MKITSILTEDLIQVNIPGETKEDVINAIIDLAAKSQKIKDIEKVRQAIFEREKIMSTGVGKGFAIPHGKTDAVTDIVAAFGITENPID
ncbi:MAG TPA: PTS sugar transporter subunit IIA, partial [Bacteroidota bacterium]|nr:PTS sugar transporter subunit IIA [Bacteroidota bacterium]